MRRFRRQELRVESFELVEVGPGLALVRLAAEWRSEVPSSVTLIAVRGGVEEELPALPEPPGDGGGLWRAAFSAQEDVLDASFWLQADDGRSIALPALVPRAPQRKPTPAAARSRARTAPAAGDPVSSPAEEALRTERARAERTEASLREQLRIMVGETADFLGRLEGYELKRAELEKELSWERLLHKETRRMLAEAEQEVDELSARVDETATARRQLASARERIEELERQVEEQDRLLGHVRASVDRGSERLAGLEERLLALREAGIDAPAAAPVAPPEVLERAWEQADRGSERLAALERRLTELRQLV